MSIFIFTRDGVTYQVSGPAGATEEEALAVLDAQLISGTLVGQKPGTVIDLPSQVRNGLNLVGIQIESTTVAAVDELPESLPEDAVEFSDIAEQKPGEPVGTLDGEQVRGLLAQKAKTVGQAFNAISNEKGLGKYGLNLRQLEKAGFIKPGISKLLSSTVSLTDIVKNPGCWTGKDNVVNLEAFQNNPAVQQVAQQEVLRLDFNSLTQRGLIPPNILPQDLGAVLNTASNFNVETAAKWLQGQLPTEAQAAINTVARAGQYATAASKVATLVGQGSYSSAILTAGAALGVSSSTLNTATKALSAFDKVINSNSVVGNAVKASLGSFGTKLSDTFGLGGEVSNLIGGGGIGGAITGGGSILGSIPGVGDNVGAVVNSVTNTLGLSGVTSEISNAISSLAGNSGIGNALTAIGQGAIPGLGNLSSLISGSGIGGALGGAIPGLGNLTSLLGNVPGVGNLLSGLTGGNISGLNSLLSAFGGGNVPGLGSIVSLIGSNIPGLGGLVSALGGGGVGNLIGAASNLLGIGNIGGSLLGSLGGLGGLGGALGGLGGVASALGPVGAAVGVFTSFFGGGGGDSGGLNFSLDSPPQPVPSFQNTVNRATVDAAVTRIIGDSRVNKLNFGSLSSKVLSPIQVDSTGIQALKNLIGRATASAASEQAKRIFDNLV